MQSYHIPSGNQERQQLKKFAEQVKDLSLDDETLLRFLRARNHNFDASEKMLREAMNWRKENSMHLNLDNAPPEKFRHICCHFCGVDNNGCAVAYVNHGAWKLKYLLQKGYGEDLIPVRHYLLEQLENARLQSPRKTFVFIIDMEKVSFSEMIHVESLQLWYDTLVAFEQYYPETLNTAYVINAPKFFALAWIFLKKAMNSVTLSKVTIYDSNKASYFADMMKTLSIDQLPDSLRTAAKELCQTGALTWSAKNGKH